jgi:hypothetical protein
MSQEILELVNRNALLLDTIAQKRKNESRNPNIHFIHSVVCFAVTEKDVTLAREKVRDHFSMSEPLLHNEAISPNLFLQCCRVGTILKVAIVNDPIQFEIYLENFKPELIVVEPGNFTKTTEHMNIASRIVHASRKLEYIPKIAINCSDPAAMNYYNKLLTKKSLRGHKKSRLIWTKK